MSDGEVSFKGLEINLSNNTISIRWLEKKYFQYLGGRGLAHILLLEGLREEVQPLSAENEILICSGLLVGTGFPGATRVFIGTKSPFNNGIAGSSAAGDFSEKLKKSGFDYIKITGKASKPVYINIDNDDISIRDAVHIWGKDTDVTDKIIKKDNKNDLLSTMRIGQAGEACILSSCVIAGYDRVAARCGIGAVFGFKKLKAIAVNGNKNVINNDLEYKRYLEEITDRISSSEVIKREKKIGTLASAFKPEYRLLAGKNFSEPDLGLPYTLEDFQHKMIDTHTCPGCPVYCIHDFKNKKGDIVKKCEGNTVWDLGTRLAIEDPDAILELFSLCQKKGFDIDNLSGVVAWAIECYQKGLIDLKTTGGIHLKWGDVDIIKSLIQNMLEKTEFGELLARGCRAASEQIGNGTEKYCIHIKNQELFENLRDSIGWSLGVCVSERAGTHTRGAPLIEYSKIIKEEKINSKFGFSFSLDELSSEGKVDLVIYYERYHAILDSLGVCYLVTNWTDPELLSPEDIQRGLNILYKNYFGDILELGEKIHTTGKMFNMIHTSFKKEDDFPPTRMTEEKVKSGRYKGYSIDRDQWETLLNEYYLKHGWNTETGYCKKETIFQMGFNAKVLNKLSKTTKLK